MIVDASRAPADPRSPIDSPRRARAAAASRGNTMTTLAVAGPARCADMGLRTPRPGRPRMGRRARLEMDSDLLIPTSESLCCWVQLGQRLACGTPRGAGLLQKHERMETELAR
eukprot:SAG22_NODE_10413_length_537_cov_0.627854_1_plen_113_part_00